MRFSCQTVGIGVRTWNESNASNKLYVCVVCAIKRFKVIVYYIYIDTLNASTRSRAIPLNQLWHAPTFLCFSTAAGMLMRKNVHFMADI